MRRGSHHTAETLAKMSAASLGRKPSSEARAKMSLASLGRKLSPETRAKMSAVLVGNKRGLGRKHSPETLAKMSAANRGPNYRTRGLYCARAYESAWGQIPLGDNGRAYSVHHRDGNRQNDDPENLIALTNVEHATLENALRYENWDLAAEIDAAGASRRQPCALTAKGRR